MAQDGLGCSVVDFWSQKSPFREDFVKQGMCGSPKYRSREPLLEEAQRKNFRL